MTKECAIELLEFAEAAEKARWDDIEDRSAYLHMAMSMAFSAGMTWDEVLNHRNEQARKMTDDEALRLMRKHEMLRARAHNKRNKDGE